MLKTIKKGVIIGIVNINVPKELRRIEPQSAAEHGDVELQLITNKHAETT